MRILAIDLGKFKSVACLYDDTINQTYEYNNLITRPGTFQDAIESFKPERLVIEVGSQAGWVCDVAESLGVAVEVANPNHEGWRWQSVKRKTDRDDAKKLAQLSALGQLPIVMVPKSQVRQMRSLITYRQVLVGRRTAIKNSIRAVLDRQGLNLAAGKAGWSKASLSQLRALAIPLAEATVETLWRGQLFVELQALDQIRELYRQVETKLDALAKSDERVARLQSIPGVGPRLAETIVAVIDQPERFKNAKQVGAYAGLVPKQYESGIMARQGRITGQGNRLLRALLVEVSWLMRRYNAHFWSIFERVCRGSKSRRKIAVVAVARRLLIVCWAMLRDGTCWRAPAAPSAAA